jgi:hypothetical protein
MTGWSTPRPGSFVPGKEPSHRRLGERQGQSGRERKISPPPPRFDHQTAQSVADGYTDHSMTCQEKLWNITENLRRDTNSQDRNRNRFLTNAKLACERTDRVTLTVGNNGMNADRKSTVVFAWFRRHYPDTPLKDSTNKSLSQKTTGKFGRFQSQVTHIHIHTHTHAVCLITKYI